MRIAVVGAGIGGLAAAVALQRDGHELTLIERAPALGEVGAGVVLGPHAMRALVAIGADRHIRDINQPPDLTLFSDLVSGAERSRTVLGETGEGLYGTKLYTTHRRDLIDALAGGLGGAGLKLGRLVVDIAETENEVRITLDGGETVAADILVGADGLKSTVRTCLFGESGSIFTGFLAWRTVFPAEALGRDLPNGMSLWMGDGRHVVAYPIRKGRQIYAAFYVPAAQIRREDWSASGDVRELRLSFADACGEVRELVDAVEEAFITGIYFREPLAVWHRGRTVLVGDAAHPVLPTSGSGAGLALEDAVTLAACLRRHGGHHGVAFEEFEARRKSRTTRVLMSSRADLTAFHESNPVKIAAAGPMARGIAQLDPTGRERMGWLYGYDEVAESAKPFEVFSRSAFDPPKRPEARDAFERWRTALRLEDSIDNWVSERAAYDRFTLSLREVPGDLRTDEVDCDGVPALRVVPGGCEAGPGLLFLHGGGYVYGSAAGAVGLAGDMARAIGGWALVPDYRLAPEHDAAALHGDVRRAHGWLASRTRRIFVGGECAGAALAVTLAAALRDAAQPIPLALYLASPFVDLTLANPSIDANRRSEPYLTRLRMTVLAGAYMQADRPADPLISPVLADLSGLPPLLIHAAAGEALADDARALHRAAQAAGVDSSLTLVEDSVHSFVLFAHLPETCAFLASVGADAQARLAQRSGSWTVAASERGVA